MAEVLFFAVSKPSRSLINVKKRIKMKIVLMIYVVGMIIYDVIVGVEMTKNIPPRWTWKEHTRAVLILLGLGLIWPLCLGIAAWKLYKGEKK